MVCRAEGHGARCNLSHCLQLSRRQPISQRVECNVGYLLQLVKVKMSGIAASERADYATTQTQGTQYSTGKCTRTEVAAKLTTGYKNKRGDRSGT